MAVVLRSNQITGISLVVNATDGATKEYADTASTGGVPSIAGNENEFLTTDGSNASWQPIQGYQEYTTAGNYTFNIPTHAKEFFIEATGAGGGGAPGLATTSTTYVNRGEFWFLRTSGTTSSLGASANGVGPFSIYDGRNYIFANVVTVSSTDTITWILRTTAFGAGTIYGIAYGSDKTEKYVIAGTSGIVASSTDSIAWTLRTAGFGTSAINTASYGNGFYFVGDQNSGSVRVSTDAIMWQFRTTAAVFQVYHSVYGGGYYVVGGSTDHVRSSTDTIVWIMRTTAFMKVNYINAMTYGNGIFIAANSTGNVCTSTDSINWVARTSGAISIPYSLHYGLHNNNHSYILGISGGPTSVSTDGIIWILRTAITGSSGSSVYGNGIHVKSTATGQILVSTIPTGTAGSGGGGGATVGSRISRSNISGTTLTVNVGSGGTSGTAGAASTVSWTSPGGNFSITANGGSAGVNTFPSTSNILSSGAGGAIITSNNYLYSSAGTAGGTGGYFESSTNNTQGYAGSNATTATLSYQTTGGGGGASSLYDGQFGTFGGTINYYSNTYQNSKTLINGTSSLSIGGLSYGNGGNGGGAQHGAVAWILRTSGFGSTAYAVGYGGGGVYVLAGALGILFTSTDTITWTSRTAGFGSSSIREVISDVTTIVAVSDGGAIRSSTNAIQWTIRTCPTTNSLGNTNNNGPAAIYANNLYLVGGNNTYIVSTNSVVWTLRTVGFTGGFTTWSITYGSALTEKYLIAAGTGLASSTDNISWTIRTSGFNLNSIQYFNGKYYGFSSSASIRTSTNGIEWTTQVTVAHSLYASAVSNNSLITGGATGSVYSSTDAIAWVLRTSGVGAVNLFASGYGNGLFLASYGAGAQLIIADSNLNAGNGGSGIRGGGGGGGGYNLITNTAGTGGNGGDGYVRISWQ